MLDWSLCPVVECVPGKVGGAWLFKSTRVPVSALFEYLESGAAILVLPTTSWPGFKRARSKFLPPSLRCVQAK
jgi:hypothetical protein